ncbi:prickle planar cell polarity protein 3-like isoform X2 [Stegodyphus dumicola]|uniref:prickle planar cell polarity protein 3-like isoform X2 n=1 Tax=Stegodyphus dumicola TaxID=202533 RepID=UPI0015AF8279|nr:prickle planar cell polarity protein 3-like isoform X2 [Stegodyphus dumicola]
MQTKSVCRSFTLHPTRKLCKNCRNLREDHILDEEDISVIPKVVKNIANISEDSVQSDIYTWLPLRCPSDCAEEFFQGFPEEKIPKVSYEGQEYRLRQIIKQIPLSDISPDHCRFVNPEDAQDVAALHRDLKHLSLRIGFAERWKKGMPLQCPTCLLLIEGAELVVLPAAGSARVYHPSCFVCSVCLEFLVDLIHCIDVKGDVYCIRHYCEKMKFRCHACDELIFASRYVKGHDVYYHSDHLRCFACDELLEDNKGYEKDDELYCGQCYEKILSYNCKRCKQKITFNGEKKHMTFEDQYWHYNCFNCDVCNNLLSDGPFEMREDKLYCVKCYNSQFGPRCAKCGNVFEANSKLLRTKHTICLASSV